MTLEDIDHAIANILKALPPKPPHVTTVEHERRYALQRVVALEAGDKILRPTLQRLESKVADLQSQIAQLKKERDEALQMHRDAVEQLKWEKQRADAALTLANAHEAEATVRSSR